MAQQVKLKPGLKGPVRVAVKGYARKFEGAGVFEVRDEKELRLLLGTGNFEVAAETKSEKPGPALAGAPRS